MMLIYWLGNYGCNLDGVSFLGLIFHIGRNKPSFSECINIVDYHYFSFTSIVYDDIYLHPNA